MDATHSLNWNGIKPVLVNVYPVYNNLDPAKIEMAITRKTKAIYLWMEGNMTKT
ncbi:DegT/DnrJ/EryC1/StrS family aminotransferase [Saccharicrinis sp. FJH62]|uniref:DegT/DnrJ/EryC1/StrS family aminotransferase n=1 Tax=Saccharicrinis sp. FJH62 TaxID=3344657 RepID=UPI0035D4F2BE